jgi:hypothetical protein
VYWHIKDLATTIVLGHVVHWHAWDARSFTIYWYFSNQNYFNYGRWIANTASDEFATSCSWTGPHVHETHETGNAGTWSKNSGRGFTGNNNYHNKQFIDWTRKVVW